MKPIIIVGGWMRSGTTMMMKALEAGGVELAYTPGNEDLELSKDDYKLHVHPELFEGKAAKALKVAVERLYPWEGGYKIIFMQRDSREQMASWYKRAGKLYALETIEYQTELSLAYARNRRDAEVIEVDYNETLVLPVTIMQEVGEFIGVEGFDFEAAAALIDPKERHFRIEDMTGVEVIAGGTNG